MPSDHSDANGLPAGLLEIYKDISNNIRVSDNISFKLLGIVPLGFAVGSGALAILEKSKLLEAYSGLGRCCAFDSGRSSRSRSFPLGASEHPKMQLAHFSCSEPRNADSAQGKPTICRDGEA